MNRGHCRKVTADLPPCHTKKALLLADVPTNYVQVLTNMKTGIGTIGTTRLHLHLFLLKYFRQRIEMTNLSPFGHLKPCFLLTVNINRTESVCREFGTIGFIIDFTLFCIRMVQYQSFMAVVINSPVPFISFIAITLSFTGNSQRRKISFCKE